MSIVDKDSELVFLLELDNLVKEAESTGHTVYTLSDEEDTAACLLAESCRSLESLLAAFIIIMTVCHSLTHVHTCTVDKASMSL